MDQPVDFKWTKEYEMDYWEKTERAPYLKLVEAKLGALNVKGLLPKKINRIVSVGGGRYGDVFNFIKEGTTRLVVDPLSALLEEKFPKDLPEGVHRLTGFSQDLKLPDNTVDVMFCLETLDHCESKFQVRDSIAELVRVTKKGGLIFFQIPIRREPREGHPISLKDMDAAFVDAAFFGTSFLLKEDVEQGDRVELFRVAQKA